MRWFMPLVFFALAFGAQALVPDSWGERDDLTRFMAFLGLMIFLADLIVLSLGRVFNPYSHLWCFIIAPGTILHELGHYVACLATGLEVTELRLFKPNPDTGQLGNVKFRFPEGPGRFSVVQGILVAMAPFITGALALYALCALIAPDVGLPALKTTDPWAIKDDLVSFYQELWRAFQGADHLGPWRYLALYGVLVIGSGAAPSTTDFLVPLKQSARKWLGALVGLLFLAGLGALILKVPAVARPVIAVLALAAACQMLSLSVTLSLRLLVALLGGLRRALGGGNKEEEA